jgi:single-stranded-DNA-specific exonuclease
LIKRWSITETNPAVVRELSKGVGIDPLLATVLVQRGMSDVDQARVFFNPVISDLHDPFLMRDMDLAVECLAEAVNTNERILLYGDYDVDGTTSVALMYAFLKTFYKNIDYYLPDRDKEGYGVSLAGVEYARETGCGLVIAMDCGIKANEAIAKAATYGIDFIVCDHHVPEGALPPAVANLDPKRPDCPYPFKELSGCGIAFKLAQGFAAHTHKAAEVLDPLLDFVALSIACDMVPIVGENRILALHGLRKLNMSPRLGLWALINRSGRSYPLNINDLVFGLGPLINSAGRLGDAREAVRMLLATDRNSALDAAAQLVARNKQRQLVDIAATVSARQKARELATETERKSIVLFDASWHKGIIGITASRISEDFHKPTVILTESEGRAVGSARSVPGFDLYEALLACGEMFDSFGGHAHAAGMQMPVERVADFAERFELLVQQNIAPESESPVVEIAGEIRFEQITPQFWQSLKQFAPFGPDNMNPVFVAYNVQDTGRSKRLDNNHVRLALKQGDATFSAVGFGLADQFEQMRNRTFDIVFNLREEEWRGETVVSLVIKDIR